MASPSKRKASKKNLAVMADSPCIGKADKDQERAWRAESDARTLMQADEIRGDKERLKAAKQWAADRAAQLKNIEKLGS